MRFSPASISRALTAGALGGLVNSLLVWSFGASGLTAALGVALAPAWTSAWLYPRVVWGGIWGLLFLLPILETRPLTRALVVSLAPTLVQTCVVFPFVAGKGWFGLELGMLTPILVLVFNAAWGIAASVWMTTSRESHTGRPGVGV